MPKEKEEDLTPVNAPKKIYLQHGSDTANDISPEGWMESDGEITWCWHDIHGNDVEYIRADLVGVPSIPDILIKEIKAEIKVADAELKRGSSEKRFWEGRKTGLQFILAKAAQKNKKS